MDLPIPKPILNTILNFIRPKINKASESIVDLQDEQQQKYTDKFIFGIDNGIIIGICIQEDGTIKRMPVNQDLNLDTISVTQLLTNLLNVEL